MTSKAKHTPGPWRIREAGPYLRIVGGDENATVCGGITTAANAAFIVRAGNSHQALVDALTAIVNFCDDPSGSESEETLALGMSRLLVPARAALAKAETSHD